MPTDLPSAVEAFADSHALCADVRRLGVAVSGGSDSVALLRLLQPFCKRKRIGLYVLHYNHRLRNRASDGDARFVARLASRLHLSCHTGDWASRCPSTGASLEMAARAARQAFFRQSTRDLRLDAIATGHTADDVAETLLLRLARGSGSSGLAGLRPAHRISGVRFIRPLLDLDHTVLQAWLRSIRQGWREDASNADVSIARNRVRHVVLPWLERHWSPSLRAKLRQSASILRDEDALLDEWAAAFLNEHATVSRTRIGETERHLPQRALQAMPVALRRRVVRRWLIDAGHAEAAGWEHVEQLLTALAHPGRAIDLPDGVRFRIEDGRITHFHTSRGVEVNEAVALAVSGEAVVAGVRVSARRTRGIVRGVGPVGQLPAACTLDAGALAGKTLTVRTRRPGDRIRPLGMKGSKTLQDLLVDAKVPAEQRDHLPLVVVDDEVVWVPGYRVSRAFAVRGPRATSVRIEMRQQT